MFFEELKATVLSLANLYKPECKYCREEPILTSGQIIYSNICLPLLLFAKRVLFYTMTCLKEPCPSA